MPALPFHVLPWPNNGQEKIVGILAIASGISTEHIRNVPPPPGQLALLRLATLHGQARMLME